jgi:proteic killer suppression protein
LGLRNIRRSAIEVSWSSAKLEKACTDDRQGRRNWGADNWKLLKRRLAALQAAPTLADMDGTPGHCHELRADRKGEFALYLWSSYRLVFEPADEPLPTRPDRGIDWSGVTKIEIKEVVDYHGK